MDSLIPQGIPSLTPTAPKKRNWLMIIGIIIVAFIAFVGLIVGCVFSMGKPVMLSGETFLRQITAGNVQQAYESAGIQFKQNVTRENLDGFLKKYPVVTKVKTISFNEFSIENDTMATLSGTITATDGQVAPLHMRLVKENDGWRVLYFDVMTEEELAAAQQAQQQGTQQAAPQTTQPLTSEQTPAAPDAPSAPETNTDVAPVK
jgi:hypothetical protein